MLDSSQLTVQRCASGMPLAPDARREIQIQLLGNFAGVLGLMLNSGSQLLSRFAETARSTPPAV